MITFGLTAPFHSTMKTQNPYVLGELCQRNRLQRYSQRTEDSGFAPDAESQWRCGHRWKQLIFHYIDSSPHQISIQNKKGKVCTHLSRRASSSESTGSTLTSASGSDGGIAMSCDSRPGSSSQESTPSIFPVSSSTGSGV